MAGISPTGMGGGGGGGTAAVGGGGGGGGGCNDTLNLLIVLVKLY